MPKGFRTEDTGPLIKAFLELQKDMELSVRFLDGTEQETRRIFAELERTGFFTDMAETELDGGTPDRDDPLFRKLVRSAVQLRHGRSLRTIRAHAEELAAVVPVQVERLKPARGKVAWFFASRRKKEEAEAAYAELTAFGESDVVSAAGREVEAVNRLRDVSYGVVLQEYRTAPESLLPLMKNLVPEAEVSAIDPFGDALRDAAALMASADAALKAEEGLKEAVRNAVQRMVTEQALAILRQSPIDGVSRERSGIRVKALHDGGYHTVADAFTASEYELASVNGISRDVANAVKRYALSCAEDARKTVRIRLSYDDQSKPATEVVLRIYCYRRVAGQLARVAALKDRTVMEYDAALEAIRRVRPVRFWAFTSAERRSAAVGARNALLLLPRSDFAAAVREAGSALERLRQLTDADRTAAWEDFRLHPIDYTAVLEELCPDVLGTDESVNGLPEALAREVQEQCFFPDGLLCTLRRYQEFGVKYILHQERVLLGDEMGLGKTVQAIAAMVSLKNTNATHFAVLCPASVLANWCREIAKHSKLKPLLAHGTEKQSAFRAWMRDGGVLVTNYESLRPLVGLMEEDFRFSLLVADEAHYIKNKGTQRRERTARFAAHAERMLLMTGTPLENDPNEMVSLIELLRPDIANAVRSLTFMANAPEFREKIAQVYYRRKRENVLTELPDKIENDEWCEMSEEEEAAYEVPVMESNWMGARRVSWNVSPMENSSKMKRLLEIVADAAADARKVLVFSFFLDTVYGITNELVSKGVPCMDPISGSVQAGRRQEILDQFEKAQPGAVLVAQIQSGGTGLNIQSASVVVLCEPQIKPSIEDQAISRAYRMGQARSVQVFRLLCENTIDERMLEMLEEKRSKFDAFADKSVAAEKLELTDQNMKDIIQSEIDRINAKRASEAPPAAAEEK